MLAKDASDNLRADLVRALAQHPDDLPVQLAVVEAEREADAASGDIDDVISAYRRSLYVLAHPFALAAIRRLDDENTADPADPGTETHVYIPGTFGWLITCNRSFASCRHFDGVLPFFIAGSTWNTGHSPQGWSIPHTHTAGDGAPSSTSWKWFSRACASSFFAKIGEASSMHDSPQEFIYSSLSNGLNVARQIVDVLPLVAIQHPGMDVDALHDAALHTEVAWALSNMGMSQSVAWRRVLSGCAPGCFDEAGPTPDSPHADIAKAYDGDFHRFRNNHTLENWWDPRRFQLGGDPLRLQMAVDLDTAIDPAGLSHLGDFTARLYGCPAARLWETQGRLLYKTAALNPELWQFALDEIRAFTAVN